MSLENYRFNNAKIAAKNIRMRCVSVSNILTHPLLLSFHPMRIESRYYSTYLFKIYEITRDNTDMSLENYRYKNAKTGPKNPRMRCVSLSNFLTHPLLISFHSIRIECRYYKHTIISNI